MAKGSSLLGEPLDATPRPGRRNRRFTREERRADIVRVAMRLVPERGYYGVTLTAVANECGMTLAGLMHYFRNKDELLVEVLETQDRIDRQMNPAWEAGHVDDPRSLIDERVRNHERRPELVLLHVILNTESLVPGHPAKSYFDARYNRVVKELSHILSGHFDDPQTTAKQLEAILEVVQLQWLRFPEHATLFELWTPMADAVFADGHRDET